LEFLGKLKKKKNATFRKKNNSWRKYVDLSECLRNNLRKSPMDKV